MSKLSESLSNYANTIRKEPDIYNVKDRVIEIYPITVDQFIAIQPLLIQIQFEDVEGEPNFEQHILPQLKKLIVPIKAVFTELNIDMSDMIMLDISNVLMLIVSKLGVKDFLNSITLISKVSRDSREIIALAEQTFSTQSIS